jgi:hypothetical protein
MTLSGLQRERPVVMDMKKTTILVLLVMCFCSACKTHVTEKVSPPLENQSAWSIPSNGLSAKLVLSYEDSFSRTHTKVIHPKLFVRNVSSHSIKFLKGVYFSGNFIVTHDGKVVQQDLAISRSGPQGAETIVISPSESIEFDTYDYGYGLMPNPNLYAFNTNSLQVILRPGTYWVDYSLGFNKKQIEAILKRCDWLKDDPDSLWMGEIKIERTSMVLP